MNKFQFINMTTDDDTPPIVRHWQAILRRIYQQIARDDLSAVDLEYLSDEFSWLCRGKWEVNSEGKPTEILLPPPADEIVNIIIAGRAITAIEAKQAQNFAEGIADALASIGEARPGQLCVCAICEDVVEAGNSRRTYCSNKCRLRAFYKRRRDEEFTPAKTKVSV